MSCAWNLILFLQCRFLASNKAILVLCSVLWSNNLGVLCPPWMKSGGPKPPFSHISHSSPSHLSLISFTSLTHLTHLSLISFTSPSYLSLISHTSLNHLSLSHSPLTHLSLISFTSPSYLSLIWVGDHIWEITNLSPFSCWIILPPARNCQFLVHVSTAQYANLKTFLGHVITTELATPISELKPLNCCDLGFFGQTLKKACWPIPLISASSVSNPSPSHLQLISGPHREMWGNVISGHPEAAQRF